MSALPVPEVEGFSLPSLVRAALQGDQPDPHRIAEDLIAAMSLADARGALAVTLPDYVRKIIHTQRQRGGPAPSSSKWTNVAQLHATGELALLRLRVFTQGTWKFLGDCTREDVTAVAEDRDAEAAANTAAAERFRALRKAMNRHKATVVRDVPADALERIFNA